MKKIYLGLGALVLSTGMIAQNSVIKDNFQARPLKPQLNVSDITTAKPVSAVQSKATPFWSDDFSDPTTWGTDNAGQTSPMGWAITSGAPESWALPTINSTSGGNYAELYNGNPQTGSPAPASVTYTITTSGPIDVLALNGGSTAVSIQFEQYGAKFQDFQQVFVSTDSVNWTMVGDNSDYDALTSTSGSAYANPDLRKFNIGAAIAANPDSVWIRFSWSPDVQAITYGWLIDDVALVPNEDHEINMGLNSYGTFGFWEEYIAYKKIPVAQVSDITFYSEVKNIGANDEPNTVVVADINSGASSVSSPLGFTSLAGTTDTLYSATFTPAAAVGSYTFDMSLDYDNSGLEFSPANNSSSYSTEITQNIYALDNGTSTGSQDNSGDGYEAGNLFDIHANATAYSIQVEIDAATEGNPLIYGKIYESDLSANFSFVDATSDITVPSSIITNGGTMELIFDAPVQLTAGKSYVVVVGSYGDGGASTDLAVGTAGPSKNFTSWFYDEAQTTWFYLTSAPMVRLNFDAAIGVEENEVAGATLGQNFPNPANGNTSINYTLTNNADVMIQITDLSGKVISVINEGAKTAGTYTVDVNTAELSAGTYFYSLTTENGTVTKSMNVIK